MVISSFLRHYNRFAPARLHFVLSICILNDLYGDSISSAYERDKDCTRTVTQKDHLFSNSAEIPRLRINMSAYRRHMKTLLIIYTDLHPPKSLSRSGIFLKYIPDTQIKSVASEAYENQFRFSPEFLKIAVLEKTSVK